MINGALLLFIILLLALVLCSFLGGKTTEGLTNSDGSITEVTGVNGNTAAIAVGPQGNIYTASNINGNVNASSVDAVTQNTFYGPNGESAKVTNVNGTYDLAVTDANGTTTHYTYTPSTSSTSSSTSGSSSTSSTSSGSSSSSSSSSSIEALVFYGPFGGKAQVVTGSDGNYVIRISYPSGQYIDYTTTNQYANTSSPNIQSVDSTINQGGTYPNYSTSSSYYPNSGVSTNSVYGANGGSAGMATGPNGNSVGYATGPYGNTMVGGSSQYYSGLGSTSNTSSYYPNSGVSAGMATGPNGNSVGYATGPYGNTVVGGSSGYGSSSGSSSDYNYSSSLPQGISRSMIPPGDEDLYILKSEVVPPVCPACPTSTACPRTEKCPPCPACARCPEPSFECKKVPNYNTKNNQYLPVPVLSDFSTFGM